jgi:hypothetical protein
VGNNHQVALSFGNVAIILIVCALWIVKPGNKMMFSIFIICSLMDVMVFGYSAVIWDMPTLAISQLTEKIQHRSSVNRDYRICALWNEGMVEGEWNLHGYAGITPIVKFQYQNPEYIRQLAVTRIKYDNSYHSIANPLPRVRTTTLLIPTDIDHLQTISEFNQKPFVMLPIPTKMDYGEDSSVLTVHQDQPQYLDLTIKTPHPVAVVIADRWDANWVCLVNGQPMPILKAFDAIRCIVLENAGDYRIEFRYAPLSYTIGKYLTLLGVSLWMVLFSAGYLKRHGRN